MQVLRWTRRCNQGHLCVKGRYAFDFAHAADRRHRPMIREGRRLARSVLGGSNQVRRRELRRIASEAWRRQRRRAGLGARHQRGELPVAEVRARRARHQQRRLLRARLPCADRGRDEDDARHRRGDQLVRRHRARARRSSSAGANPTENHPVVGARIKQAALRGAKLIVDRPARDRAERRSPTCISS